MILVGTVFLVQNNFYSHTYVRGQAQQNARAMKDIVESEIRATAASGVTTADSSHLILRSNMSVGVVCGNTGNDVIAYFPSSAATLDTTEVGGFGYRNPTSGAWSYFNYTWSDLHAAGGTPAATCYASGADTTGASGDFYRLNHVDDDAGVLATAMTGYVIMLYRRTEFQFSNSSLISGDRALWWGLEGGTLKELVTGMATNAHFEFRTGTNTWAKSVTGASLANINGVRVVAQTIGKGETSSELTYDFTINVDIPLQNAY